jgi:hypothetical protein
MQRFALQTFPRINIFRIANSISRMYIDEFCNINDIFNYLHGIPTPSMSIKLLLNKPYNINVQLRLPHSGSRKIVKFIGPGNYFELNIAQAS